MGEENAEDYDPYERQDATQGMEEGQAGSEEEEDMEWDEVGGIHDDVEIILPSSVLAPLKSKGKAPRRRNPFLDPEYRAYRLHLHRVHLLCLLLSARHFCSFLTTDGSPLLLARLLSQIPSSLVNAFNSFSPRTHPNERDRSRMFDAALKDLIFWWWERWEVTPEGTGEIRSWSFAKGLERANAFDWFKWSQGELDLNEWTETKERIQGEKSLMKRAVTLKGSRDMMAYLFAGTLRALDIPCRVVVSLQPVDHKGGNQAMKGDIRNDTPDDTPNETPNRGKKRKIDEPPSTPSTSEPPSKTRRLNSSKSTPSTSKVPSSFSSDAPATSGEDNESEDNFETYRGEYRKAKRKGKKSTDIGVAPAAIRRLGAKVGIKLRTTRIPTVGDMISASMSKVPPPTVWVEVYSRPNKEWITVDVTRNKFRCQSSMEPIRAKSGNEGNRMLYVVGIEEDLHIKDLTPKYTKAFATEISRLRPQPTYTKHGKERVYEDWWNDRVVKLMTRRFKLSRDEKEDAELLQSATNAPMPTTLAGFKSHPLYVLERDLLRDQILPPEAKSIGTFRGLAIYPRSAILSLKSPETWMREGLQVIKGEQPLKMVKMRAVTLERRRQIQAAGDDAMQGLYSRDQVELVIPEPVIDGKVPKNSYGNLDLFAPHMLPAGGVHLPYRGIAKVAKRLGIDYSEAVVGFEFRKQRAVPVLEGIVVPMESEELVMEAYWHTEQAAQEKILSKQHERCLKNWRKLILGLQIRQHVEHSYKTSHPIPKQNVQRTSQLRKVEIPQINDSLPPKEQQPKRTFIGTKINLASQDQLFTLPTEEESPKRIRINLPEQVESAQVQQPLNRKRSLRSNSAMKTTGITQDQTASGRVLRSKRHL